MKSSSFRLLIAGVFLSAGFMVFAADDPPAPARPARPARPGDERREVNFKVGDAAPDFELVLMKPVTKPAAGDSKAAKVAESKDEAKNKTGKEAGKKAEKEEPKEIKVKLSSLKGSKPVLLIFGSYT